MIVLILLDMLKEAEYKFALDNELGAFTLCLFISLKYLDDSQTKRLEKAIR